MKDPIIAVILALVFLPALLLVFAVFVDVFRSEK
jgi:hypothetical protein